MRSRGGRRRGSCIHTSTRADLLVVAPCTANTLAKLAQGIADNVLTEAALAHRGPILLAPAMNHRMWSHAATQANVQTLAERGVELIGPEEGELAEGESGTGACPSPRTSSAASRNCSHRPTSRAGASWSPRGHAGAARRGSLHRQPLLRPDGGRARAGGAPSRRARHAPRREPCRRGPARRRGRPDADRGRFLARALARAEADSSSCPRRSPTTGRPTPRDKAREGRRAVDDRLEPTEDVVRTLAPDGRTAR